MIRVLFRCGVMWCLIGAYVLYVSLRSRLLPDTVRRRRFRLRTTSRFCRWALGVLGVRVNVRVFRPAGAPSENGVLYVANHLSYLDVLVLAAQRPSVFITSRETRQDPFLGLLARLGGSVFVERRNKFLLLREIRSIAGLLQDGFSVVLFAEGTSSDGQSVLPFKVSLFATAEQAGVDVVPVCLRYQRIDGSPLGPHNRDRVYYYGSMRFLPHFFKLFLVRSVTVTLVRFPPIPMRTGLSRKKASELSYTIISRAFTTGRFAEA